MIVAPAGILLDPRDGDGKPIDMAPGRAAAQARRMVHATLLRARLLRETLAERVVAALEMPATAGWSVDDARGRQIGIVSTEQVNRVRIDPRGEPEGAPREPALSVPAGPGECVGAMAHVSRAEAAAALLLRALVELPPSHVGLVLGEAPGPWGVALAIAASRADGGIPCEVDLASPWSAPAIRALRPGLPFVRPDRRASAGLLPAFAASAPSFVRLELRIGRRGRPAVRAVPVRIRPDGDGDPLAAMRALAMAIDAGALPRAA